jgi:hypothetical protein
MSDKDKNFHRAMHDYGLNGLHGFNSRGIAPSFLGSDSLPQGLADLHWALHGLQGNMDMLDTRMKAFENNIVEISDDMKDDVIKYVGDKLMASKTPLTNETGYISKIDRIDFFPFFLMVSLLDIVSFLLLFCFLTLYI